MKWVRAAASFMNREKEEREICRRFSALPERGRAKNESAGERETVITFSGSPLMQLLMDAMKR